MKTYLIPCKEYHCSPRNGHFLDPFWLILQSLGEEQHSVFHSYLYTDLFGKDTMNVRVVASGFTKQFLALIRTEQNQSWCSFSMVYLKLLKTIFLLVNNILKEVA